MYLSFLWCPENIAPTEAGETFAKILDEQRNTYANAWGIPVDVKVHQQGSILIGHLYSDSGVVDWHSWVEESGNGILWNGVCENFLGTLFNAKEIRQVQSVLSESPQNVCSWDGSYFVITWDAAKDKVYLTTGASDCPTLWFTKGPRGWAAGSRGAPILAMVGREERISAAACNILLAYGYNYSNESLFEHVHRVPQRTQIVVGSNSQPKESKYATVFQFVNPNEFSTDRNELLADCAERLVNRVGRQLQYSSYPEVLITGGRDSRCIAAAAKKTGYSGFISTGGAADCSDVVIGEKVASRLTLSHLHTQDRVPMGQFRKAVDRLKLWSRMSEGVEVLRHVRAYNEFVEGQSLARERKQLFHGLGGEIGRGYYYKNAEDLASFGTTDYSMGRKILLAAASPNVPLINEARDLLEARWDEFTQDLGTDEASVAQWLDMFFWQNSCLRWGGDMLSAKNPMYWAWTPFLDRELIRRYWGLDLEDKRSNKFIQDLAVTLASELKGLEYDVVEKSKKTKRALSQRIVTRLRRTLKRAKDSRATNEDIEMIKFWEAVLLRANDPTWAHCIDKDTLRKLIYKNPTSEVLWSLATVQLVEDVYC